MRLHQMDKQYILDVLHDEEDKLLNELLEKLDNELKYKLSRLIAVQNELARISS